jgi:predicted dehydrogenase
LQISFFEHIDEAISWAELVHICTPDHLHTGFAEKSIKSGKPVLCEKPVTTSLEDALHLQSLTEAHKTIFFVGNNNRLTPTFMEMKKRIKQRQLGKPIAVYATYLHDMRSFFKKTPWRLQQNFLYGGAVHAIDLVCWIMGDQLISVYAQTGRKLIRKYTFPEDYHILLTFKSGMIATIWANARVVLPVHKADLQIYLENGTFVANNKSGVLKTFKHRKGMKEHVKDYKNEQFNVGYRYTIPKEIEIVNKFITKRSKFHDPVPRIDDVIPLMKILHAIEKSIELKKVITL